MTVAGQLEDYPFSQEGIRASLQVATDGSIDLLARAWAVRGTRA